VIFTVVLPLILLVWAWIARVEALQRLLITYWRVASLLMITVYLFIPGWGLGFVTSPVARILIPLSLWFWADINEEIRDLPQQGLGLVFRAWRWAITIYCTLGAIANLLVINCVTMAGSNFCAVWLEAPQNYQKMFHGNTSPGVLGFLGAVGLFFYGFYFGNFLLFRLGKQGRSALEQ
jgi:hypothetical protein